MQYFLETRDRAVNRQSNHLAHIDFAVYLREQTLKGKIHCTSHGNKCSGEIMWGREIVTRKGRVGKVVRLWSWESWEKVTGLPDKRHCEGQSWSTLGVWGDSRRPFWFQWNWGNRLLPLLCVRGEPLEKLPEHQHGLTHSSWATSGVCGVKSGEGCMVHAACFTVELRNQAT